MKFFLVLCALAIFPTISPGQVPAYPDCTDFSMLPAEIGAVDNSQSILKIAAGDGNFCYATKGTAGSGLMITWGEVTAGSGPLPLGTFSSTLGTPTALDIQGTLVCVSYMRTDPVPSGWILVDFADPSLPVQLAQEDSTPIILDLAMADDLVCVAAQAGGFSFFDIADPLNPVVAGSLAVDRGVSVAWESGTWFLGGRAGIDSWVRAYDLNSPSTPVLLGAFTSFTSPTDGEMFMSLDGSGGALAVRLMGYYPDPYGGYIETYSLLVLDVTDPTAMTQAARFNFGQDFMSDPVVGAGTIYLPTGNGIRWYTHETGSWVPFFNVPHYSANVPIAVANEVLLVGNDTVLTAWEATLDIPDPAVGAIAPGATRAVDMEVSGSHAFISRFYESDGGMGSMDHGDVAVYDILDPTGPVFLHSISGFMGPPVGGILVHGEYLHTTIGSFHWPTGDLADAHIQMYRDGLVFGDVLYAIQTHGFRVYDLIIPSSPAAVGDYLDTLSLTTLVRYGNYLYAYGLDLTVFDISSPMAPALLGTYPIPGTIQGGTAQAGMLYLTDSEGLLVYDLTDPGQPVLSGQLPLGSSQGVTASGTTAYVSATNEGLVAVDVSVPGTPVGLGRYFAGSDAIRVSLAGDYLYSLSQGEMTSLGPNCPSSSEVDDQVRPVVDRPYFLRVPYPNPFNPATILEFDLARPGGVNLAIHDAAGRLVSNLINGNKEAGPHSARWEGRDQAGRRVSAGVYFAVFVFEGRTEVQKLVLIK